MTSLVNILKHFLFSQNYKFHKGDEIKDFHIAGEKGALFLLHMSQFKLTNYLIKSQGHSLT